MATQDPAESPESTLERIMGERREKAAALRAAGSHPYRNDIGPTISIADVRARYEPTRPPPAPPAAPVAQSEKSQNSEKAAKPPTEPIKP
ncbi:MAG: hypothetical protein H0T65_08830, partial [Deltaproteobacteria bacterium]|nr:hypothetical protein [Deltaproteobacteria bacterium]